MIINFRRKSGAAWLLGAAMVAVAGCGGGGSHPTPTVPSTSGITVPAPVAGQNELLFVSDRAADNASKRSGLFFTDLNGGKVFNIPIILPRGAREVAWLPGRNGLLYVGYAPTTQSNRSASSSETPPGIRRVNRDGKGDREVPNSRGARGLVVSPDGRRIAYSARFITVADADGTNSRILSEGSDPAWSPDGARLIYRVFSSLTGNSGATSVFFIMGADGSDPTRIPASTGFDTEPDWSPDGRRIVFRSIVGTGTNQKSEIFAMNADGSNRTRLTNNETFDSDPQWTPDGQRIVFASMANVGEAGTLQVMNVDGTGQRPLVGGPVGAFDLR